MNVILTEHIWDLELGEINIEPQNAECGKPK